MTAERSADFVDPTVCPAACAAEGRRVRLVNGLCRACGYDARPPSALDDKAEPTRPPLVRPTPFTVEVDEWGEGEWLACAGHVDLDDFLVRCREYARTQWLFKDAELADLVGLVGVHRWAIPHPQLWSDDEPYVMWCDDEAEGGWPITVLDLT